MIFKATDEQRVRLYGIATAMKGEGLPDDFITAAVKVASECEGTYELMAIWADESDADERAETLADIQEMIDENADRPRSVVAKPKVPFDDLNGMASQIKAFKAKLRERVDMWGGISKLARETGMPQPSLSRFFSTASMPRRTTLHRIARAVGLSEEDIAFDHVA